MVALGAAIQAAIEVGEKIGDAVPRFTLSASSKPGVADQAVMTNRRVIDVMSHSLGTIAVSPDGSAYSERYRDSPQLADPGAEHQVVHP